MTVWTYPGRSLGTLEVVTRKGWLLIGNRDTSHGIGIDADELAWLIDTLTAAQQELEQQK